MASKSIRGSSLGVLAVLVCTVVLVVPVQPAWASSFHGYGVAGIKSGNYTAISATRYDEVIYVPSGSNCTVPYSGSSNPAYQTEWINDQQGNWMELGTGHQCSGFQYWYAGYGSGGIWYSLWTHTISSDNSHRCWIQGKTVPSGDLYTFNIDTTLETSMIRNFSAGYDQTGLESYSSSTTAAAYTMSSLTYATTFSNTSHSWSGTYVVANDSPLCVHIYSATDVVSGENVSC